MTDSSDTLLDEQLDTNDLEHVFVEFSDLNGISRSKQVTADYFREAWRDGFPVNMVLLVQTPRNHVPSGSGYGEEIDYGDGLLRPVPATFQRLPWRDDSARVLCDLEFESRESDLLPRSVLQSVVATIDLDLEFYLLEGETDSYEPVTDHKHEWISWATEQVAPFYDRLAEWAPAYDIPLQSLEHEHGPGQLEVLFDYGPPLSQADRTFDFRRLVKRTAQHSGYNATFMAKPFSERSGNGYHLHVSAFDGEKNAFADQMGGLSDIGRSFVAGVLDHANALTAFHAPTFNAFKRFGPGGFAPYTASWGFDNRMTSLRIPSGTIRVENRIGSADTNPYLVIAGTLAAGVDGIKRSLEPTEAVEGDPTDRRPLLPRSLDEALSALETNEMLIDAMGKNLVRAYVASKRRGLDEFRDHVTDWERDQYVDLL